MENKLRRNKLINNILIICKYIKKKKKRYK